MTGTVGLTDARVTDVDGESIRVEVGYGFEGGYGHAGVWVPRNRTNWQKKVYPSDKAAVLMEREVMERVALRISQFKRSGRPVWLYLEGDEPNYQTKPVAVFRDQPAPKIKPVFKPVNLPMAAAAITG